MGEINLLDTYPRTRRPIAQVRGKGRSEESRVIAKQFGEEYFDGTRERGYGGYYYDGRWKSVARHMAEVYDLTSRASILDIGCAKGFLLYDFLELLPGVTVAGVDISRYAIEKSKEEVKPFLEVANATHVPFSDKSFDLVVSINVVHNLPDDLCRQAIGEMERVSRKYKYLQVDSFSNDEERRNLEEWQLTAELIYSPEQWKRMFEEVGYAGDYYWTITE